MVISPPTGHSGIVLALHRLLCLRLSPLFLAKPIPEVKPYPEVDRIRFRSRSRRQSKLDSLGRMLEHYRAMW